jgi:hypothetical protein
MMEGPTPRAHDASTIVCILGMHRSGTSCLAGSLEEAGLFLGDVVTRTPHNLKGTRENRRIFTLHDGILGRSGGSWQHPPDQIDWTDADRAERDAIIRSYPAVPHWGFKDPRTLLLLDLWRERLRRLSFVATFRHPGLVAASLSKREGGSMDHWLALWARYNGRMLALHTTDPFPIVRFDLGEDAYRRSLAVVTDRLGLQALASTKFFDAGLRHQTTSAPSSLPEPVSRVYDALCRVALDP